MWDPNSKKVARSGAHKKGIKGFIYIVFLCLSIVPFYAFPIRRLRRHRNSYLRRFKVMLIFWYFPMSSTCAQCLKPEPSGALPSNLWRFLPVQTFENMLTPHAPHNLLAIPLNLCKRFKNEHMASHGQWLEWIPWWWMRTSKDPASEITRTKTNPAAQRRQHQKVHWRQKLPHFQNGGGSARAYLAINPLPGDIPTSSTSSIDECNRDKSTIVCPAQHTTRKPHSNKS